MYPIFPSSNFSAYEPLSPLQGPPRPVRSSRVAYTFAGTPSWMLDNPFSHTILPLARAGVSFGSIGIPTPSALTNPLRPQSCGQLLVTGQREPRAAQAASRMASAGSSSTATDGFPPDSFCFSGTVQWVCRNIALQSQSSTRLTVSWDNCNASNVTMSPAQTEYIPEVKWSSKTPSTLYSVAMVAVGAASTPAVPLIKWFVVNIPASELPGEGADLDNVLQGVPAVEYVGAFPESQTMEVYVIVLFEQDHAINVDMHTSAAANRGRKKAALPSPAFEPWWACSALAGTHPTVEMRPDLRTAASVQPSTMLPYIHSNTGKQCRTKFPIDAVAHAFELTPVGYVTFGCRVDGSVPRLITRHNSVVVLTAYNVGGQTEAVRLVLANSDLLWEEDILESDESCEGMSGELGLFPSLSFGDVTVSSSDAILAFLMFNLNRSAVPFHNKSSMSTLLQLTFFIRRRIVHPLIEMMWETGPEPEQYVGILKELLQRLEDYLATHNKGGPFCSGRVVSVADLVIFDALETLSDMFAPPEDTAPYLENLSQLQAVVWCT